MMRISSFVLFSLVILSVALQAQSSEPGPVFKTSIFFDFGAYDLRRDADTTLTKLYASLQEMLVVAIDIVAHTDAIGTNSANDQLSLHRAQSVRTWLIGHAIDSTLIHLDWKGEIDSVAVNGTDEGRQKNRRAEIRVYATRKMVTIHGSVTDSLNNGLPAKIVVHGAEFKDSTTADSTGQFSMSVPDSTVFGIDVFLPGYLYTTKMFKSGSRRIPTLNIKPIPIKIGVSFELHRFYFVGNEAILLKKSKPELRRLLRFMEMNPTVEITIEGHVNFPNRPKVSRESWEYNLSFRRAQMVFMFLLEHGVHASRLTFEAFGNWHMVFPKARSETQMAKNRRVEIRILDY